MTEQRRWVGVTAIAAVTLLGALRIASTWRVFSQTVDEPIHVASGFELLETGRYTLDVEHPPLARILFALGPALTGARVDPAADRVEQGRQIFERGGRYRHNLAQSRLGNLPFFLAAAVAVAVWAARLGGWPAALAASLLFTSLPPILGHAGLATTDMPAAATTVVALLLLRRWLESQTWADSIWLAIAIAAGLLSKFSFPLFFATGAAVLIVASAIVADRKIGGVRRAGRVAAQVLAIGVIALIAIWSCYDFSSGTVNSWRIAVFPKDDPRNVAARYAAVDGYEWVRPDIIERYWAYGRYAERRGFRGVDFVDWAKAAGYRSPLAGRAGDTMRGAPPIPPRSAGATLLEPGRRAGAWIAARVAVPAPEFITGLMYVWRHSQLGHPSYLLGDYRAGGWWYYFPVLFFFKTPVAFTLLALSGVVLLIRHGMRRRNGEMVAVGVAPLVMLVPAMSSGINIGLRHVLPIYPLLAIAAGYAVACAWVRERAEREAGSGRSRFRSAQVLTIVLLVWHLAATTVAHPDYLAYFNELAGPHPDRIAVDSNLDWGQDLLRLEATAQRRHIGRLHIAYFGSAIWNPPFVAPLEAGECVSGWIAVSETIMKQGGADHRGTGYRWLEHYPHEEIGRSIRLYRVPEGVCGGSGGGRAATR